MHRRIPWFRTDLGDADVAAVATALRDRRVTTGPLTAELERRVAAFLGVPDVVAVNSGAAALLAALKALGIGPGDEVVLPGCSFVAPANAVLLAGAEVRLADVDPVRAVMDPGALEAAIGPRTRAVIPVHPNGRAADLDTIREIARRRCLVVIEDAAQALGSRDRRGPLGTGSDAGCFSTGITKLLATGEGGIIAARDPAVLAATRRYRNQGAESPAGNRFDHEGFNLRPTDVLSALGVARMDGIDARTASLRRVHRTCREAFSDLRRLRLFDVDEAAGELPLWVEAIAADRDRVIAGLAARGIEAKPYPPALCDCAHLRCPAPLPRSRFFADHGIVLPSGPDQPDEDLARVALALREIDRQDGGRMPEAP